jgi:hypothetical protein
VATRTSSPMPVPNEAMRTWRLARTDPPSVWGHLLAFGCLDVGPERQTHRRVVTVLEHLRLRDNPA